MTTVGLVIADTSLHRSPHRDIDVPVGVAGSVDGYVSKPVA